LQPLQEDDRQAAQFELDEERPAAAPIPKAETRLKTRLLRQAGQVTSDSRPMEMRISNRLRQSAQSNS
jgi:hypothetical protein